MEITMPSDSQTIHWARAVALAITVVVSTIPTVVTAAYADNESAAAIAPPYQTPGSDRAVSGNESDGAAVLNDETVANDVRRAPAGHMTSDVLGAGGRQDELASKIYRPGVSDR
jgi:hypothetical protein